MGGSQSTRKISVDNDEAVGVIRVSENVAERLKNLNKEGNSTNSPVSNLQPQVPVSNEHTYNFAKPSEGVYIPQPYITSTMVRQQIERELDNNNDYWRSRIKQLKDNQTHITQVLEKEFDKAYKEVEIKFPKAKLGNNVVPCEDYKSKIVGCFKSNANQTLNCSGLVNEFTTCISNSRSKQDIETRSP